MGTTERERELEWKVDTLEHRLGLLERYLEMRFCETFRDFSSRNSSKSTWTGKENRRSGVQQREREVEADKEIYHHSPIHLEKEVDENEKERTTYTTRSGRKSTRLKATLLGSRNVSKVSSKGTKSSSKSGSDKILQVCVRRLEDETPEDEEKSMITENETLTNDDIVVKENQESESEVVAPNDDDGNFFSFSPAGCSVREAETNEGIDQEEEYDSRGDEGGDDDPEWNPEERDDEEPATDNNAPPSSSKKRQGETQNPRLHGKKYKYFVPASQKLIPEGVKLQLLKTDDESNLEECDICHAFFKPDRLHFHMKTHVADRHLKCSMCEQRFFCERTLRSHERRHKATKSKKCRICSKGFYFFSVALAHERICIKKKLESGKQVDPALVEDVRNKSSGVELHWPDPNEKGPDGMKKCLRCNQYIPEGQYQKHVNENHPQWKCTLCDKMYALKHGLIRHLINRHGQNQITCERCQNVFEGREEFRRHNPKCRQENNSVKKQSRNRSVPAKDVNIASSAGKDEVEHD